MPNFDDSSEILAENLEAIQADFQKVLNDHGIADLRVSHFRLSPTDDKNLTASTATDSSGCWRWVCQMTPTGQVCQKVWDPNC